jgi:DNA-binding IclR family transcriptional regulator
MSKIVARTLDFVELFAQQRRPLTLSDIARLLHIPASSCHDVLQTMIERGYIYEVSPRGGYYPTQLLLGMTQTIAAHDPVALRVDAPLRALREALDETVMLALVSGLDATYLLAFHTDQPLRVQRQVGERIASLYATSAGKALLGSMDEARLEQVLADLDLKSLTAQTTTDKTALRAQIKNGQARGYYVNQAETLDGITTISATFAWNPSLYIVTVAGPSARMANRIDQIGEAVADLCARLAMQPTAVPGPKRSNPAG